MYAQVIRFKLKDQYEEYFRHQIDKLIATIEANISGFESLLYFEEIDGIGRKNIMIVFDDEISLSQFGECEEHLNLFEEVKESFVDGVYYFDSRVSIFKAKSRDHGKSR